MKNYKIILKRKGRNLELYSPLVELLKEQGKALTIREMAELLKISYSITKQRLHKLKKHGIISRLKRGYYCLPFLDSKYRRISKPQGKCLFINGSIRVMGSSNGVWITVYNSKYGEAANNKYCNIEYIGKNKFIIKKTNKVIGNKLYLLLSRSVGIPVSRKLLPKEILSKLSTKTLPIKLGVYYQEWGLSIKDLFSTESKEDGELADELSKMGDVEKPNKFAGLKADVIFIKDKYKIPIEVTAIKPSLNVKTLKCRRGGAKSAQILSRLFYSIKWNFLHGLPTVIVLHKDWVKYKWIMKEKKFMENFNCFILFTGFGYNWAKKITQKINLLTESSLLSKTTLLTSE